MDRIEDLLKINFENFVLIPAQNKVIPQRVSNLIETRIEKLNSISLKLGTNDFSEVPNDMIKIVYRKFKRIINTIEGKNEKFSRRELKNLTFALNYREEQHKSIFESKDNLGLCLRLFNKNWKDSFISGLFGCYLHNWDNKSENSFKILSDFLIKKISNYSGSRRSYLTLKKNIRFFKEKNGNLKLGATLAHEKIPIRKITEYVNLPESWLTYSYFIGVIEAFVSKVQNEISLHLDDIESILIKHSGINNEGTKANQIITSELILISSKLDDDLQNRVKDLAFRLVGDPGKESKWLPFDGATPSETEKLFKAKVLLNQWITQKFIYVFFEKCINEERRKRFWLQYSDKISNFRIFGPSSLKHVLKRDKRIMQYVDSRYKSFNSSNQTSAFVFELGRYTMIEFSDNGYAFYAYLNSSEQKPNFNKKYDSANDFTDGRSPFLASKNGWSITIKSNEGRLSHQDGILSWEEVFEFWIKEMTGINA